MFRKYHYLNDTINTSSQCYLAEIWGKPVGFISVQHFPHRYEKRFKKVGRLVVLPDYQGIGIGKLLLNEIAKLYKEFRFTITTSHPSLNRSLVKDNNWKLLRQGKVSRLSNTGNSLLKNTLSINRNTCSWEHI